MEIYFHIPHIPLEPPTIKVKLMVGEEASGTLDNAMIDPATKLFPTDYPWEYQTYTIADITNIYASIPIPQFEPFNVFFLRMVHAVCPIKTAMPNQWIKNKDGWIFRGCLKVYRHWHYEEDYYL